MRLSLRYRLLLPLTLLLIGDAVATAWAASAVARVVERRIASQQWAVARTLTESRSTFRLTGRVLEQMKGFSGAEFLFIPPTGPPESTFPDPKPAPPTNVPIATQPMENEEHTLGPAVELGGNEYRCLRLQLRRPHPDAGANLYILYPESLRRTAVRDAVRPLLILGGWWAWTGIDHVDNKASLRGLRITIGNLNLHCASRSSRLDCVAYHICKQVRQLRRISQDYP